jgi:hypothetical protein
MRVARLHHAQTRALHKQVQAARVIQQFWRKQRRRLLLKVRVTWFLFRNLTCSAHSRDTRLEIALFQPHSCLQIVFRNHLIFLAMLVCWLRLSQQRTLGTRWTPL